MVKLGEIICGNQGDKSWNTIFVTEDCWCKFLKFASEKLEIFSRNSEKKINDIKTLRFEHVTFKREDEYTKLKIFKRVYCLQFVDYQIYPSSGADGYALHKISKTLPGITELHFENTWDEFLKIAPKEAHGDFFQYEKIDNIKRLHFKRIIFAEKETYSSLKLFKDVRCLQFINCRTYPNELAEGSALNKINEALPGIAELHIENASRVVYMNNFKNFEALKIIKLKQVDSFVWEDSTKLELVHLFLDDVPINESIVNNILAIESLEKLELSAVYRGDGAGEVLRPLGEHQNLTELRLSNMPITEQLGWIEKLTKLRKLELTGLKIEKLTASTVGLHKLEHLFKLVLDNNPINEIGEFAGKFAFKKLKRLSIANTLITKLPKIESKLKIRELNCSRCRNINWETFIEDDNKKEYIEMFKNLIRLDFSHNEIMTIPKWFENIELKNLRWLNISDTKFLQLPFLNEKMPNIKCLIAENLNLVLFPREILKSKEWCLHNRNYDVDRIYERFARRGKDMKRAYLRGTMAKGISPHFFTGGYKDTRIEFWDDQDYSNDEEGHQATIVFLGEKGKKNGVICSLFDVSPDDLIECGGGGQTLINTEVQLQVAYTRHILDEDGESDSRKKKERLASDTKLNIWTLSQEPEYRSGHGMFMPNNALYVIVIDAENALELQRKADFWFRFIRYNVDSADILFLLLKNLKNSVETINLEKFKMDSHCHVHRELAYMASDKNDDIALDKARGILTHAIQRLPSYRGKVSSGWKRAFRHISGILEVQPSLSYCARKESTNVGGGKQENLALEIIYKKYFEKEVSVKMLEVFRILLTEAGVCYDDGEGNLYSRAWISCFVYATMKHASEKRGKINLQELKMYLLDNVAQYDYFDLNIKKLLDMFSRPIVSKKDYPTKKRAQMCVELSGDKDTYLFPQFTYICERPLGPSEDKSQNEISEQEKWRKQWSEHLIKFRNSRYVNRYIINMPLLADELLVDIICRLMNSLISDKKNDYDFLPVDFDDIAVGADGLMALWRNKCGKPEYCLLVDGVPSAPGRLQILVGPYWEAETKTHQNSLGGIFKLLDELAKIHNCAFGAFFDVVKENIPLMINMKTYLALPNYYLAAPFGVLEWRLALRDIYYCKKNKQKTFDYLGGVLPMDILEKFIPKPYEKALENILNWKISYGDSKWRMEPILFSV